MTAVQTIRCIVVDDELPARKVIEKFVSDIPGYVLVAQCKNAFEAMEALQQHHPDLMFLDINMPKLSGLSFLKTLSHPPLVIITTAYREYAIEGFDLDVLDYLHKPFSAERFYKALQKARQRLAAPVLTAATEENQASTAVGFLFVREDKRNYRVETDSIIYVEAVGDYVKFHTTRRDYLAHQTLRKTEESLGSYPQFLRIHKSFIVNMDMVQAFEGNMLILPKKTLSIGQQYRQDFDKYIESLNK